MGKDADDLTGLKKHLFYKSFPWGNKHAMGKLPAKTGSTIRKLLCGPCLIAGQGCALVRYLAYDY